MPGAIILPTIGTITGATFLNTFLIDLNAFLKKNSGCPVIGFIEFNPLPTTYLSGSLIPIIFI